MKTIYCVQEPSSGILWCIAINGWYIKENGNNKTFSTRAEAEKWIDNMIEENPNIFTKRGDK